MIEKLTQEHEELAKDQGLDPIALTGAIGMARLLYEANVDGDVEKLEAPVCEVWNLLDNNAEQVKHLVGWNQSELQDFMDKLTLVASAAQHVAANRLTQIAQGGRNRNTAVKKAIEVLADFYCLTFGDDRFIVGWRDNTGAWPFMRGAINLIAQVSDNTLRAQMELIVHEKRGRKAP